MVFSKNSTGQRPEPESNYSPKQMNPNQNQNTSKRIKFNGDGSNHIESKRVTSKRIKTNRVLGGPVEPIWSQYSAAVDSPNKNKYILFVLLLGGLPPPPTPPGAPSSRPGGLRDYLKKLHQLQREYVMHID